MPVILLGNLVSSARHLAYLQANIRIGQQPPKIASRTKGHSGIFRPQQPSGKAIKIAGIPAPVNNRWQYLVPY